MSVLWRICTLFAVLTLIQMLRMILYRDVTSPISLRCPSDIRANISINSTALVNWTEPVAMNNNGQKLNLKVFPPGITPPHIFNETTLVVYTATDESGNKDNCSFKVMLEDNSGPVVVYCPPDQHITATKTKVVVTWKEPHFKDNSHDPLVVKCSHQSGTELYWGTWNVYCIAFDSNPNNNPAVCQFNITIQPTLCPVLKTPRNGAIACSAWLSGRFCSPFCNIQSDFSQPLPASMWVCSASGNWLPTRFSNTKVYRPGDVRMAMDLHYFYGDCNTPEVQAQIKQSFIQLLNGSLFNAVCQDPSLKDKCKPEHVKVTCSYVTIKVGRATVNCSAGYFFNNTSCHACAEDQYQDQKNQTSCIFCPSGTSTFGKGASKSREDCEDISTASDLNTGKKENSGEDYYQILVIALGPALLICFTGFAVCSLRKRYHIDRRQNIRRREGNRQNVVDNAAIAGWMTDDIHDNEPIDEEIVELQPLGVGFYNSNNSPENNSQALDDAHANSDNVNKGLSQSGQPESINDTDPTSSIIGTRAGGLTSVATKVEDFDSHNKEGETSSDSQRGESVGHDLNDDQPVTQRHCLDIRHHVGDKWKDVLRELPMDETTIKILELDYKDWGVAEKFYQGLLKWKDSVGPQRASIKNLVDALRRAGCSEALNALWKGNTGHRSYQNSAEPGRDAPAFNNTVTRAGRLTSESTAAEDGNRSCHHNNEGKDSPSGQSDDHNHSYNHPPVTENHCLRIKDHVGVDWKDVLRELSIKETTIRNLEEDYKTFGVVEKCYQGLLTWMEIAGPRRATIENLADALRKVGCSEALETLQRKDKSHVQ